MVRTSAILALASAALLTTVSANCSASIGPSREVNSRKDLAYNVSLLVGPGTLDVENVYLPAVEVRSYIPDSAGKINDPPCSGVLIDSRAVLTAAHCVCLSRAPTSQDILSLGESTKGARALRDMIITGIVDRRSPCARTSTVITVAYEESGGSTPTPYLGTVLIHPDFELITGIMPGQPWAAWNNADLAVIILERPVASDVRPVSLPDSEVKVGDAVVMAGYGSRGINDRSDYGSRRFGENEVTELVELGTGSLLFGAAVSAGPKYNAPAHTGPGDSGGACVRKENPNILIGIATMGLQTVDGTQISYFTSVFPHRRWLSEILRQVDLGADAGVNVPDSHAGSALSLPPADR